MEEGQILLLTGFCNKSCRFQVQAGSAKIASVRSGKPRRPVLILPDFAGVVTNWIPYAIDYQARNIDVAAQVL